MDFWFVLSAVGSIASLIAFVLPLQTKHQRFVHLAYGLSIFAITSVAVWYWSQFNRIKNVERAATSLVSQREMKYTHEGYIQAALAFLEKNKDIYPDAYERAKQLCNINNCLVLKDSTESVHLAFALDGLLKGIGTLESGGL